ncbi:MAG TPA: ATP-binding protein [Nitrospirota bacterium]|nr:ATP-binding protein [Nitrospirota bacterium]
MSNDGIKKRSIFRRIFILYAVIMVLAVLFTELYITDTVRDDHITDIRDHLVVEAALIANGISFRTASPLDDLSMRFKETTGSRVTIISLDGRVLGDSDTDSTHMDNHTHRQEIQQASLNGIGMAIRHSDTLKYDFLYVAKKIMKGPQPEGFIRLSVPLREIDRSINILRIKILSIVVSVMLAAGIFSLWQIERIRRLTGQIRNFSRSIARGELGRKLFLERAGEFDEIAESLNTMSVELKNSIASHEEERHRLNVILRSIPDALFIIDAHGVILLSSLAARKLFGEIALQGKPFIEVMRNSEFLSLVENVQKQQAAGVAEIRIGSPLEQYCVVQVSPLFYDEREPSGFIAVFHDITQLKKLEQTRTDFVANISHEIKTPITAIQGFADTLLEGALDDRENAFRFLQTIKMNSERINSLVDDLMTISKIELGVIKVKKSIVDVQEVVDHVLTLLRDKAAEKNLTIRTEVRPEPRTLEADRDRLIQILTNLVDNAIKFTEKGGVAFGDSLENGKVYLFVEDTGIGIPQRHLPRLGERFYRVDPGRSRNMGGTGLGLAIVKHLVKAHDWDIRFESTPGKGTKVKIFVA